MSTRLAYADQGTFSNAGGTTSVTSYGVVINSSVATPAGPWSIDCPATGPGTCAGGSLTFASNDGTVTLSASFTSATFREGCSGGRYRPLVCSYSFTGYFSGMLTANGVSQAVIGGTSQAFRTGGAAASGTAFYNSTYTPFYFSNTGQILRSDDLNGTNLTTYGTQGGGVGQFYGAYSIALDSAGRIYVADTYNSRIVRIDDMNGTNWASFGTYGSDVGQFNEPQGVSVDPAGRIYVMDTGNNRLVRIDDLNGTNWTTMTALGSGVGQFAGYSNPVAFDASGRIYVADTGNGRLVRMDDMDGTNWTTLTQSPPINGYSYSLGGPSGVALDAAGRIYVLTGTSYNPTVVRVDDMTGANWKSVSFGANVTSHSIAVDPTGMVLVGGGGARIVDNMTGVLTSAGALTRGFGPYYVFGATLVPLPSVRPSAISVSPGVLSYANQNIGTSSSSQAVTITNIGGSALNFSGISASGPFVETDNCQPILQAGASCTVNVSFAPTVAGAASGQLTLNDDSGNLGASQTVALSGTGMLPQHLSLSPATVTLSADTIGDDSSQTMTVSNTSGADVGIAGIAMSGDPSFTETNTCGSTLSAGATCTVTITFSPTASSGIFASTLVVTETSGAQEIAAVTGTVGG